MIEIHKKYKPFLKRLTLSSKFFVFAIFMAYIISVLLTGEIYIGLMLAFFFVSIVILSLFHWNIYFIESIIIGKESIKLKIYKYDKIILSNELNIEDVNFEISVASYSKRGTSYKLDVILPTVKYSQFEVNGWNKNDFDTILNAIP